MKTGDWRRAPQVCSSNRHKQKRRSAVVSWSIFCVKPTTQPKDNNKNHELANCSVFQFCSSDNCRLLGDG